MGKTAAETIAVMTAVLDRLASPMRDPLDGGIGTFDDDTGGVGSANGRIRPWLPRTAGSAP